jgi:D-lactate dehydrogenase
LGIDVYEKEHELFFEDHSHEMLKDEMLATLMTMKNVLITAHQGFLTDTALKNIARETIKNLDSYSIYGNCENEIPAVSTVLR